MGERAQQRTVELLEEGAPGDPELAHRPRVEPGQQCPDRGVQLGQTEEAAVPQGGEDPPLDHEHARFDDGFIPRVARPGRHHGRPVVLGELQVGAIDDGLVAARLGDAAPEVVGHEDGRGAAPAFHHSHVGGDPRREVLRRTRLGVHVAARPEHADEQLDGDDLAGRGIDDRRPLAGEVHEGFLARAVDLAHRGGQRAGPVVVVPTELAVAVAVGVLLQVLEVEPLQGHPRPLELLVDPGHVGQRPGHAHDVPHPLEQPGFELGVVPLGRQRPCQARLPGPAAILRHRAQAHAAGAGDRPVGQALLVLQSKNLADLSHQ